MFSKSSNLSTGGALNLFGSNPSQPEVKADADKEIQQKQEKSPISPSKYMFYFIL